MADRQENLESLTRKAEEYFLIAKLAADRLIERRYEGMAEDLRHRITEALDVAQRKARDGSTISSWSSLQKRCAAHLNGEIPAKAVATREGLADCPTLRV